MVQKYRLLIRKKFYDVYVALLLFIHLIPLNAHTNFNPKLINAVQNHDVKELEEFLDEALENNHSILIDDYGHIVPGKFDINEKSSHGNTLLHCIHSPYNRDTDRIILECILLYKADPTIYDRDGQSAMHYITLAAMDQIKFIPLIETLVHHSRKGLKCLEEKDYFGLAPLHYCAHNPGETAVNVATALIRLGANIDVKDRDNRTPLQLAADRLPEKTPVYNLLHDLQGNNAPRWYKNIDC